MTNMKKINDRFTVGMAPPSADDLRDLAEAGYKSVVNLRCEEEPGQPLEPARESEEARAVALEYKHIPVSGDSMSNALVDQFRDGVKALPGPVFVHCASGKRAGAFTMMHLAAENGMSGDATLEQAEAMGFACDEPALEQFVRGYVDGQRG
ncbi:MAG: protein tyrosine phosphatase family protein [Pontixanthobacter sp.]